MVHFILEKMKIPNRHEKVQMVSNFITRDVTMNCFYENAVFAATLYVNDIIPTLSSKMKIIVSLTMQMATNAFPVVDVSHLYLLLAKRHSSCYLINDACVQNAFVL